MRTLGQHKTFAQCCQTMQCKAGDLAPFNGTACWQHPALAMPPGRGDEHASATIHSGSLAAKALRAVATGGDVWLVPPPRVPQEVASPKAPAPRSRLEELYLDGVARERRRQVAAQRKALMQEEEVMRNQKFSGRGWSMDWAEAQLKDHQRRCRAREARRQVEQCRREKEELRQCTFAPRRVSLSAQQLRLAKAQRQVPGPTDQQGAVLPRGDGEIDSVASGSSSSSCDLELSSTVEHPSAGLDGENCPTPLGSRWRLQVYADALLQAKEAANVGMHGCRASEQCSDFDAKGRSQGSTETPGAASRSLEQSDVSAIMSEDFQEVFTVEAEARTALVAAHIGADTIVCKESGLGFGRVEHQRAHVSMRAAAGGA